MPLCCRPLLVAGEDDVRSRTSPTWSFAGSDRLVQRRSSEITSSFSRRSMFPAGEIHVSVPVPGASSPSFSAPAARSTRRVE